MVARLGNVFCGGLLFALAAGRALGNPTITNFTPTFGAWGDNVTIEGTGFSPGTLSVYYNGVQDTSATLTAFNAIQSRVPTNSTTGPITVKVGTGSGSSLQDFTVIGRGPYITSFNPSVGSDGDTVMVQGVHFMGIATNAYFNGRVGTAFHVLSDSVLQVNAPVGVTTGPISVRGTLGTSTTTTNFFVAPVITRFSPANGRPGTNVIITGTNFLGIIDVRFGAFTATTVNVLSNGAVQVSVPPDAVTATIRVDAPAGSFTTTSNFVVLPTISGFSPAFGAAGTSVIINGANFTGATAVRFNGTTATFNVPSFSQLTSSVPASATSGPISVTTTNGTAVSIDNFYVPATITSFSPTNSPSGSTVRINGLNFTNATSVTFNGTPASFVVTNNTTIGAIVPANITSGPITVTTPAGQAISLGFFYAPPGITQFSPTHGLPSDTVTLTGSNFLGASAVLFNGLSASFVVNNNNTITATVPSGAVSGPLTVVAPAGTNTTSSSFILDYTSDLVLTMTNTPDPVIVTSNLVYTLSVLNNGPFAAPNVRLTNTLPASVLLKAATTTQGTLVTNVTPIYGNLGTLGVGATATIVLTVAPQATGSITNMGNVVSDYIDPTPANASASTHATVLPLPLLSITRPVSNVVRVAWPVELTNFVLQYKATVTTNTFWSNVIAPPLISGSQRTVNETNPAGTRFYRLKE